MEGLTLAAAKKRILDAKLALGKIYYEESAAVGAGLVMKASRAKGETVAQTVTSIDLWVSIGSKDAVLTEPEVPEQPDSGHTGNAGNTGNTDHTGNTGNTGKTDKTDKTEKTETPSPDAVHTPENAGSEQNPDAGQSPDTDGTAGTGETGGSGASSDIAGLLDMRNSDE